jgi:cell division septal protein FtsQ
MLVFRKKTKRKINSAWQNLVRLPFVRITRHVVISLGLLYLLGFGIFKLTHVFLSNVTYFTLSQVYVKDHFTLEGGPAFEFAGLKKGTNLFNLNLRLVAQEIKRRHPEYAQVTVKISLPNRIDVLIRERVPVIQVKLAKFYPVDKHGFVVAYAKETPYPGLPIIIGIEPGEAELNKFSDSLRIKKALELMAIIKTERFPWSRNLARINLSSLNDISLFLDNGIEVKIGGPPHLERLRRLIYVLDEIRSKSLQPGFIDLRFKDVIIAPK